MTNEHLDLNCSRDKVLLQFPYFAHEDFPFRVDLPDALIPHVHVFRVFIFESVFLYAVLVLPCIVIGLDRIN